MSRKKNQYYIDTNTFLLFPSDETEHWMLFMQDFSLRNDLGIMGVPGSELDVFDRFQRMQDQYPSDYLIRLTADCPVLPDQLLTKMVITGIKHRLDYLSNVDPEYRTMQDGYDIEIISNRAFRWLEENIPNEKYHHEHVTTYLRQNFQKWMRVAIMSGPLDLSDHKYSVDTLDEFNDVSERYQRKIEKEKKAIEKGWGVYEY